MQFTVTRTGPEGVPRSQGLLRAVLKLDAGVTAGNGLAYVALASILNDIVGIPRSALYVAGVFLMVCGLAIAVVATRQALGMAAISAIIASNLVWAVASMAVLAVGVWPTTVIGTAWLILQAVIVGAIAGMQLIGRSQL